MNWDNTIMRSEIKTREFVSEKCLKCANIDSVWHCFSCYNGNMFVPIEHTIKTEYNTIGRRNGKNMEVKEYLNMLYSTKTLPRIKDVIFNDPATIVFWEDGTKTVVKTMEGDKFDPHTGLAQAISKKALGDDYKNEFKKWTKTFKGTRKHRKILEMREKFEASKVNCVKPITLIDAINLLKVNLERVKSDLIRKGVID